MQERAKGWHRSGLSVCLVPTMGALHDGHISLIAKARSVAGPDGVVIVSIYVNPTQFGPHEDFNAYPRTLDSDCERCREAGTDIVFAPVDSEMYPDGRAGSFSCFVVEKKLSQSMEGASRPTHFEGVTTVVAKLFHICLPDSSVFGAKDFQQVAVIRRMVQDLNFPLEVVVAPTHRESDGLAMSSRNQYLGIKERREAPTLFRILSACRQKVQESMQPVPMPELRQICDSHLTQNPLVRLDYLECFHPDSLIPQDRAKPGDRLAIAACLGSTRLIDNCEL